MYALRWSLVATVIVALALAVAPSDAASLDTARDVAVAPLSKVRTELGDALAILHDQRMPEAQRRRALQQLAERDLDLNWMARESLGEHWNEITPAQRDEFVRLFTAFIEDAYLTQIQDYVALNIAVGTGRMTQVGYAEVDGTVIQPHEEEMPITFRLERVNNDWIVYDVVVEGVSMVHNYRSQFDRVIRNQGMSGLLSQLRVKQAQLATLLGKP